MADITMCAGIDCEIKDKCYRYLAPKSELWQSYFAETPIKENGDCAMFWGDGAESIFNQLKDIMK